MQFTHFNLCLAPVWLRFGHDSLFVRQRGTIQILNTVSSPEPWWWWLLSDFSAGADLQSVLYSTWNITYLYLCFVLAQIANLHQRGLLELTPKHPIKIFYCLINRVFNTCSLKWKADFAGLQNRLLLFCSTVFPSVPRSVKLLHPMFGIWL